MASPNIAIDQLKGRAGNIAGEAENGFKIEVQRRAAERAAQQAAGAARTSVLEKPLAGAGKTMANIGKRITDTAQTLASDVGTKGALTRAAAQLGTLDLASRATVGAANRIGGLSGDDVAAIQDNSRGSWAPSYLQQAGHAIGGLIAGASQGKLGIPDDYVESLVNTPAGKTDPVGQKAPTELQPTGQSATVSAPKTRISDPAEQDLRKGDWTAEQVAAAEKSNALAKEDANQRFREAGMVRDAYGNWVQPQKRDLRAEWDEASSGAADPSATWDQRLASAAKARGLHSLMKEEAATGRTRMQEESADRRSKISDDRAERRDNLAADREERMADWQRKTFDRQMNADKAAVTKEANKDAVKEVMGMFTDIQTDAKSGKKTTVENPQLGYQAIQDLEKKHGKPIHEILADPKLRDSIQQYKTAADIGKRIGDTFGAEYAGSPVDLDNLQSAGKATLGQVFGSEGVGIGDWLNNEKVVTNKAGGKAITVDKIIRTEDGKIDARALDALRRKNIGF